MDPADQHVSDARPPNGGAPLSALLWDVADQIQKAGTEAIAAKVTKCIAIPYLYEQQALTKSQLR
jgi:hypothetical protein